jgi:hypothetical protein
MKNKSFKKVIMFKTGNQTINKTHKIQSITTGLKNLSKNPYPTYITTNYINQNDLPIKITLLI